MFEYFYQSRPAGRKTAQKRFNTYKTTNLSHPEQQTSLQNDELAK